MDNRKKAQIALANRSQPASFVDALESGEIDAFAELVDDDGQLLPGVEEKMRVLYSKLLDRWKGSCASTDPDE